MRWLIVFCLVTAPALAQIAPLGPPGMAAARFPVPLRPVAFVLARSHCSRSRGYAFLSEANPTP